MIGCESAKEIRLKDEKRLNALREFHPVKVVWECEVKKQLLRNPEMAAFFRDYEAVVRFQCIHHLHITEFRDFYTVTGH